jgi:hypothetical protein
VVEFATDEAGSQNGQAVKPTQLRQYWFGYARRADRKLDFDSRHAGYTCGAGLPAVQWSAQSVSGQERHKTLEGSEG